MRVNVGTKTLTTIPTNTRRIFGPGCVGNRALDIRGCSTRVIMGDTASLNYLYVKVRFIILRAPGIPVLFVKTPARLRSWALGV